MQGDQGLEKTEKKNYENISGFLPDLKKNFFFTYYSNWNTGSLTMFTKNINSSACIFASIAALGITQAQNGTSSNKMEKKLHQFVWKKNEIHI